MLKGSEAAGRDEPNATLSVGSYAGHRHPERPTWVELAGRRLDVQEIEREWREEDRLGYLVSLSDGTRMVLYHDPNEHRWDGVVKE